MNRNDVKNIPVCLEALIASDLLKSKEIISVFDLILEYKKLIKDYDEFDENIRKKVQLIRTKITKELEELNYEHTEELVNLKIKYDPGIKMLIEQSNEFYLEEVKEYPSTKIETESFTGIVEVEVNNNKIKVDLEDIFKFLQKNKVIT